MTDHCFSYPSLSEKNRYLNRSTNEASQVHYSDKASFNDKRYLEIHTKETSAYYTVDKARDSDIVSGSLALYLVTKDLQSNGCIYLKQHRIIDIQDE